MSVRYREFSRVAVPGKREEIVADTSVVVREHGVVHRVHSQPHLDIVMYR